LLRFVGSIQSVERIENALKTKRNQYQCPFDTNLKHDGGKDSPYAQANEAYVVVSRQYEVYLRPDAIGDPAEWRTLSDLAKYWTSGVVNIRFIYNTRPDANPLYTAKIAISSDSLNHLIGNRQNGYQGVWPELRSMIFNLVNEDDMHYKKAAQPA